MFACIVAYKYYRSVYPDGFAYILIDRPTEVNGVRLQVLHSW